VGLGTAGCATIVGIDDVQLGEDGGPDGSLPSDAGGGSDGTSTSDGTGRSDGPSGSDGTVGNDGQSGSDGTVGSDAAEAGQVLASDAGDAAPDTAGQGTDAGAGCDASGGACACIDLQSSSSNCGTCGHVCNGGESCSGGLCQPEVLVDSSHGLNGLYHLALQGSNLYGTNYLPILSAGLAWTTSITPGTGFSYLTPPPNASITYSNYTGGMAIDSTSVWFGIQHGPNAGTWKTPIAGPSSSTAEVSGYYDVYIFAIDTYSGGPYMYISDGVNSGFAREPKSGTPAPPTCDCFNSGYPAPSDILTDASGNVYWSMGGAAKWIAQSSKSQVAGWTTGNACASTTLLTGVTPAGLGLDSTYAYFSDSGANKIKRIPIGGGTVTDLTATCTLPTGSDTPKHLVVDGSRIYWAANTGNLWAIDKDGSSTGTIAPIVTGRQQIGAVVYDANFLYFTDSGDGTVWRVSK
jgi:hypothetical protein